jgi:hypothetical protein
MLASSEDEGDDDESSSEENKLSNNQKLQCKLLLLTSFPCHFPFSPLLLV